MTRRRPLERLHDAAIRVQVPVVLAAIPVAVLLWGIGIAPLVVEAAFEHGGPEAHAAAREAVRIVVTLLFGCTVLATAGAAMLLRGSVRAVVERLDAATTAIARGDFSHRVGSGRSDELGRLGDSIDTMAERLERLEQARRRLLACVSHELRTPLTIIRGHAYSLARREPDPARRERLQLVQAEAGRLADLVEDLVDASTLHAGSVRLRVERCDLTRIARSTVERFDAQAKARGLRLTLRGCARPVPVDADPGRIEQVLANLLANAVRHADPGGRIDVLVDGARSRRPAVTVANTGMAIDPQLAQRLFEPFVQGGDRHGRVGLGLAIARGLAVAHGGDLILEAAGAGSRRVVFRLELPAPARGEPAAAARVGQPRPSASRAAPLQAVESS